MPWPVLFALLLTAPPAPADAGGGTRFVFAAKQERLNTHLYFQRGDRVEVLATGAWTMWAGHYGLSTAEGHRQRAGIYDWGRLMARVGSGVEVSVGTHQSWTASTDGELVFYPNTGRLGLPAGDGQLALDVRGGLPVDTVIAERSHGGMRVTVPAEGDGVITNLFVGDGEVVDIQAFGEWRMFEGGPLLTAAGDLNRLLLSGVPWGRLVARFGGPTFATQETYPVGEHRGVRPTQGGLLMLAPAVDEYAGHPRSGSLEVVLRGGHVATPEETKSAGQRTEDTERAFGFLRLVELRNAERLPTPFTSPELMRAAQAHAEYLATHGVSGHEEATGEGGFTGRTPAERAAACGFTGQVRAELIHGYTSGIRALDGLWAAVYHRAPLLEAGTTAYGVGVAQGKEPVYVVLAGVPKVQPVFEGKVPSVTTFPQDQQVYVPTRWSGLEEPSSLPVEAPKPVGYPISVTITDGVIERVVEAVLTDGHERPVDCYLVAPGDDPAGRLKQTVFLVPKQPLRTQEIYHARVRLQATSGPATAVWRFTTGLSDAALNLLPDLRSPANPKVDLGRG